MSGLTSDEKAAMQAACRLGIAYREGVSDRPVPPVTDLETAVARFRTPLADDGIPATRVIEKIAADADDGLSQMTSPSYHGFVLGGSHPVGVAADFLVSAWGQNAGSSAETPAITGMERAVCDWVLDLLGLPEKSGVGIVTGATVANTQGVMAARHALLQVQGWEVEENGLFGAPEIPVLIGAEAHSAPFAALRYAGFGAGRVSRVDVDDQGRVRSDAFLRTLAKCDAPPLVILQAGHINSGAFDPFEDIIGAVHERGGWVHVDGAFGLWLAAVPDLAGRLAGVQKADSWAIDLHKWLNAPFDAGLSIVRDRAPLVASMSARGAYLPDITAHWEPADATIELSRRARGVPSYAIMRNLGKSGIRNMVARHCHLAQYFAHEVDAISGLRVLNDVVSNQVAVCCDDMHPERLIKETLRIMQENGKVYPTHGNWRGQEIIRVSIIGYGTEKPHIDLLLTELRAAWEKARGKL